MKICRFTEKQSSEIYYGVFNDNRIELINFHQDFTFERAVPSRLFLKEDINFLIFSQPSKIVCVGRNYAEHAKELGNAVPKEPLLFLKAPSSLIKDGELIIIPPHSSQVEHEGELAIIIRRDCKDLSDADNPLDYIFGYTILNDVTARDIQRSDVQFTRGKSFDTFCPIGNFIETELDVSDIRLTTKINGNIKQDGRTSQMVFNVPFLVRYISNQMTLKVGDIIATGTPSGVSKMIAGDICEVEIEGIGILRNTIGL